MPYTYDDLKELMDMVKDHLEDDDLNPAIAKLGISAAYALDLINTARECNMDLELSITEEEKLLPLLTIVHAGNMHAGQSSEESRTNLIKMMGGFELFAIINTLNLSEKIASFAFYREDTFDEMTPMITVELPNSDEPIIFDVYDAVTDVLNDVMLMAPPDDDADGDSLLFFGTLHKFHERLAKEVLEKVLNSVS